MEADPSTKEFSALEEQEKYKEEQNKKRYSKNHSGMYYINHIRTEEIINIDFFKEIKEAIICNNCSHLKMELFECPLNQLIFCNECIEKHKTICTKCREKKPKGPNRIVKNLLSKLKFKCRNNCGEEFKFEDLKEHYLSKCSVEKSKIRPVIIQEINMQDVINKEYLKNIQDEVICSICLNMVFHPYICKKCCHAFCFKCIAKSRENSLKCPYCKDKKIQLNTNRALNIILSKIKFKCINGCETEVPYFKLEDHYLSECPKIDKVEVEEEELNPFTKNKVMNDKTPEEEKKKETGLNNFAFGKPLNSVFSNNSSGCLKMSSDDSSVKSTFYSQSWNQLPQTQPMKNFNVTNPFPKPMQVSGITMNNPFMSRAANVDSVPKENPNNSQTGNNQPGNNQP
ncbi:MAG: hypothetical protein MJ252_13260 [archaeon]|nr:hypothetical protein [archaeon]